MNLADWLTRIEGLRPERIKLGLERIQEVASRLGVTSLPGRVITCAGTNGKGSTIALLDALAQNTGLTTSVYTSPHLFRFNERIRQQGKEASDADICRAFEAIESARGEIGLTYFEYTTLAAFWLFQQQPTDLYLLEVGLGGRLDAVNLLDADVAVITSIGLDHTDWLGDTRDAIGIEKAGIARADKPLVYGETDMPASIAQVAAQKNARLMRAGEVFSASNNRVTWPQGELQLPTPAALGNDNLATALTALGCLKIVPSHSQIQQAAANARVSGRCEQWRWGGLEWWFDVGHNREAIARFAGRLSASSQRTFALCGMLNDKPADALLSLQNKVDDWLVINLPGERGGQPERLTAILPSANIYATAETAIAALQKQAEPGDRVIVTGSFVTVMLVQDALHSMKEAIA